MPSCPTAWQLNIASDLGVADIPRDLFLCHGSSWSVPPLDLGQVVLPLVAIEGQVMIACRMSVLFACAGRVHNKRQVGMFELEPTRTRSRHGVAGQPLIQRRSWRQGS